MRNLVAAVAAALAVCVATPAAAEPGYYLRSQTIGCPDVAGEIAIRRAMPFIVSHFDLAQIVTIKQNGCVLLPANIAGDIVGGARPPFVQFRPENSAGAWWVRRGLLDRVPAWVRSTPENTKCYVMDDRDQLHETRC